MTQEQKQEKQWAEPTLIRPNKRIKYVIDLDSDEEDKDIVQNS
jgi:hypothetical protein